MSARSAIRDAVHNAVGDFLEDVRQGIEKIDVSEFVAEKEEARDLIKILRSTLIHKRITPPMQDGIADEISERCRVWLERTKDR